MENPYHDFDQLNAKVQLSELSQRYLASEFVRLKTLEEEYKKLTSLINIFIERNILDDTITVQISKIHQVIGKDWESILRMAFDERQKEFLSQQPATIKSEAESTNS